jgi:hypothetical protein
MSDLPTRERRPGRGGAESRNEAAGQQLHPEHYTKRPASSIAIIDGHGVVVALFGSVSSAKALLREGAP